MEPSKTTSLLNLTVIVAALGYFVDIYDLLLFSIVRIPSLRDLGLGAEALTTMGESILNWQMAGLLLGGILWGVLGDKKGRSSVLFGSILLYSIGNMANGFVQDVTQYKLIRFITGIGLAGELGAGVTLVTELLPKHKRGLGTALVAGFGLFGAVVAFFIREAFHWRTCFFIGGGMGLVLLLLRVSVLESGMFAKMKGKAVQKGNLLMLFNNRERLLKYIKTIFIGLPTWYVIGILITFSSEFGKAFQLSGSIDPGKAVMLSYIGLSLGDITIGLVSMWLKSRKKALYIFYGLTILFTILYFTVLYHAPAGSMYLLCFALGFGIGFWAVFVTVGAEQFGTNLRATAATTVPNFVRGLLPAMSLLFSWSRTLSGVGYVNGAIITAAVVYLVATISVLTLSETYHKDLDYEEA